MGKASAITVVLFAIILLITIFQLRVLRRRVDY
jgi:ABC-type sugar transport system permease subunit